MKNPKHILLVKNRAMGDAIMGLGVLQYLRALYPSSQISYAIPAWIAPLFKNVEIAADRVIPLHLNSLTEASKDFWQLLKSDIDFIHECHLSGSSQKFFKALSMIKGIPYTFHNHHLKIGKVYDQGVTKALIQRDLDGAYTFLARGQGLPNFLEWEPKIKVKREQQKKSQLILGIVATRETKMWPLSFYNELVALILKNHPDIEIIIPLSPSTFDQALKKAFTHPVTFIETSLDQLPLKLAGAKLYIGNDTGLKHLAIALDIPTYTLFGPEPPLEWHPYDEVKHPYYFRDPLPCRTEKYHYCPLTTCETMICLNQFKPIDLWEKVKSYLDTKRS